MGITAIGTILSVLLGGGILTFVQFLISRNDKKEERNSDVLLAISQLHEKMENKISSLDSKVDERFNSLDRKIDQVEAKADENNAISCRVRILRFSDEMYEGRKHSKDSWDQVLTDVTIYENYCAQNPGFKNNQTEATVNYIKKCYAERLEKHDFL